MKNKKPPTRSLQLARRYLSEKKFEKEEENNDDDENVKQLPDEIVGMEEEVEATVVPKYFQKNKFDSVEIIGGNFNHENTDPELSDDNGDWEIPRIWSNKYYRRNKKVLVECDEDELDGIVNHRKQRGWQGEFLVKFKNGQRDWSLYHGVKQDYPVELQEYCTANGLDENIMSNGRGLFDTPSKKRKINRGSKSQTKKKKKKNVRTMSKLDGIEGLLSLKETKVNEITPNDGLLNHNEILRNEEDKSASSQNEVGDLLNGNDNLQNKGDILNENANENASLRNEGNLLNDNDILRKEGNSLNDNDFLRNEDDLLNKKDSLRNDDDLLKMDGILRNDAGLLNKEVVLRNDNAILNSKDLQDIGDLLNEEVHELNEDNESLKGGK